MYPNLHSLGILICAIVFLHLAPKDLKGQELHEPSLSFIVKGQADDLRAAHPQSLTSRKSICAGINQKKLEVWEFPDFDFHNGGTFSSKEELISYYQQILGDLPYEEDFPYHITDIPDDPYLFNQWYIHTREIGGTGIVDIGLERVWEGPNPQKRVIAGIIDTGIDYKHEDLIDNIWQNLEEDRDGDGKTLEWLNGSWILDPGDLDGVDNDGNGYVDDLIGWDFVENDNDPFDLNGHGTHVAGILGATSDNGKGIAGVCSSIQLMGLRAFDQQGDGSLSTILPAMEYARMMGADFTNNSWGGDSYSQFMLEEIQQFDEEGMILIAAAGNLGASLEENPIYPANYEGNNIISVAASDKEDELATFSNYHSEDVDIAAPGVEIFSTLPHNSYAYKSGTSMASPIVAGVVGIIWSQHPEFSSSQVKDLLLSTASQQADLADKVASGGRIDVAPIMAVSETVCADWVEQTQDYKVEQLADDGTYIWGASSDGLLRLDKKNCRVEIFTKKNSDLPDDKLLSLAIDQEGVLWIGTDKKGLVTFDGNEWTSYTKKNSDLPDDKIYAIVIDEDNNKWIGTDKKGLALVKGTHWTVFNKKNTDLPDDKVRGMELHGKELWICTQKGLANYQQNNWHVWTKKDSGLPNEKLIDVAVDSSGVKWIATDNGLTSFDDISWTFYGQDKPKKGVYIDVENGIYVAKANSIEVDQNNNKWLGSKEGLTRINEADWKNFEKDNSSLVHNTVNDLLIDPSQNTWLGTDGGVQVFASGVVASFLMPSSICLGETFTFENQSIGTADFEWLVNEESVSVEKDLTYHFADPGIYTITLLAKGAVSEGKVSKTLTVEGAPEFDLGPDTLTCGKAIVLNPCVLEGSNYTWKNELGRVVGNEKSLTVRESGQYTLIVRNSCGIKHRDKITVGLFGDCVWPGDVNQDGEVNLIDLFALGIADPAFGPARNPRNDAWAPQVGRIWGKSLPPGDLFSHEVDYQHVDCDGDGRVRFTKDAQVIKRNSTYPLNNRFDLLPGVNIKVKHSSFSILSEGIAQLEYEIKLKKDRHTDLEDILAFGWEFSHNFSLVSEPEFIPEEEWREATESLAWSSSNAQTCGPISANSIQVGLIGKEEAFDDWEGKVGILRIIVIVDDLSEDPETFDYDSNSINPTTAYILDTFGEVYAIEDNSTHRSNLLIASEDLEAESDRQFLGLIENLKLFPNPSLGELFVSFNSQQNTDVELSLFSTLGQLIHRKRESVKGGYNEIPLQLEELPSGIYLVELRSGETLERRKIEILHTIP